MDDPALAKLDHIYQLLKELKQLKPNTSEQEAIIKQIRALSAEYEALVNAANKPRKSE